MTIKPFLLLSLCLLCLLNGCGYQDVVQMNSYKKLYSEDEVKDMVRDYVEEKYGEPVQVGELRSYKSLVYFGYEGRKDTFKGYFIETDNYVTCMYFEQDGSEHFVDNRQAKIVRKALEDYIKDNCSCEFDLVSAQQIPVTLETAVDETTSDFYNERYEGDLKKLFENDCNRHLFGVFLKPDENNEEDVHQLYDLICPVNNCVTIAAFKPELYDELKTHFDDWSYLIKYMHKQYCTAVAATYTENVYEKDI